MLNLNVNFHGVGRQTRAVEADEGAYWMSTVRFLEVLDDIAGLTDRPTITFDDGNESDVEVALPALLERGLQAKFFLLSDRIDTPGFLSRSAVAELAGQGMDIGSHGAAHLDWRSLSRPELIADVSGARLILEDVVQQPVVQVACPFGWYNRTVLSTLRDEAVQRVYTSDVGASRPNAWLQRRYTLTTESGKGTIGRFAEDSSRPVKQCGRAVKRLRRRLR